MRIADRGKEKQSALACGCDCAICWDASEDARGEWEGFYFCPGPCAHTRQQCREYNDQKADEQ